MKKLLIFLMFASVCTGQTSAPTPPESAPTPTDSLAGIFDQILVLTPAQVKAQAYVDFVKSCMPAYIADEQSAKFEVQEIQNVEDDIEGFHSKDKNFQEEKNLLNKDFWILEAKDRELAIFADL